MLLLSLLLLALAQTRPLELRIEAPPELAAERLRMETIDRARLEEVVLLIGLKDPGPAIPVELATNDSEKTRQVASWVAGFAYQDNVVIFPSRSPSYPDSTIDDVLRHEVAHALIWRASAGRPIPRWFNEGLAMAAERPRFRDQTELFLQLASGSQLSLEQIDRLFQGQQTDQARAYLLSGALVRDLLNEHGKNTGARILDQMGRGASFEVAFRDAIGKSPAVAEADFWRRQSKWTTWLSILSSQEILWMVVTLLAILAIWRKRRRSAELRKQWDEEERELQPRELQPRELQQRPVENDEGD
jgi:hypothetical protein